MKIRIIAIGKLKEKYWREAVAEYSKRLSAYCSLQITELKESPLKSNPSEVEEEEVRIEEGKAILRKIEKDDFVITLEIDGKTMDSEELADRIKGLAIEGRSTVDMIIGGSLGLSDEVSRAADLRLSFGAMTFPHQMMRVILLEQIYRSFKIIKGETYHK